MLLLINGVRILLQYRLLLDFVIFYRIVTSCSDRITLVLCTMKFVEIIPEIFDDRAFSTTAKESLSVAFAVNEIEILTACVLIRDPFMFSSMRYVR